MRLEYRGKMLAMTVFLVRACEIFHKAFLSSILAARLLP